MKLYNVGKSKITYRDSANKDHPAPHKSGELILESKPGADPFDVSDKTGAYLKKLYPTALKTLSDAQKLFADEPKAPAAAASDEDLKLEAETLGLSVESLKAEKASKKAK